MPTTGLHPRATQLSLAALGLAALAGCSGGGNGTTAPRISTIPLQANDGQGSVFTLDLKEYVKDRENGPFTYSVVSGGGSFTGSQYTHSFDSMGEFTVTFRVSDPSKSSTGSFTVRVRKANYAVLRTNDEHLTLFDTDTENFVNVSTSRNQETFETSLPKGHMIFERKTGTNYDLFSFNPYDRKLTTLGATVEDERYVAKTSDSRVVFTRGTSDDTDLLVFNAITGLTKAISVTDGQHDRNAIVNKDDLVYYERGANGQADIYVYDPSTDASTAISTDAKAESVLGVLPDGGLVFSRIGDSGETDLYYYRRDRGVSEIGGDLAAPAPSQSKAFHASTTTSQVVFSVTASPTSKSLYFWTPSSGLSQACVTAVDLTYRDISDDDVVVYTRTVGGQDDVYAFDVPNSTPGAPIAISTNAANETFNAVVTKSGSSYVLFTRAAAPDSLHVYNVDTPGTTDIANAAGVEYRGRTSNGDVAYRLADGSAVFHLDPATGTSTSVTAGLAHTALDFAGAGSADGDFVVQGTTAGQQDLYLWDHSATARVVVSEVTGNDSFGAMTSAGEVLFTRFGTQYYLFDPTDSTIEALAPPANVLNVTKNEVLTTFSADNS